MIAWWSAVALAATTAKLGPPVVEADVPISRIGVMRTDMSMRLEGQDGTVLQTMTGRSTSVLDCRWTARPSLTGPLVVDLSCGARHEATELDAPGSVPQHRDLPLSGREVRGVERDDGSWDVSGADGGGVSGEERDEFADVLWDLRHEPLQGALARKKAKVGRPLPIPLDVVGELLGGEPDLERFAFVPEAIREEGGETWVDVSIVAVGRVRADDGTLMQVDHRGMLVVRARDARVKSLRLEGPVHWTMPGDDGTRLVGDGTVRFEVWEAAAPQ